MGDFALQWGPIAAVVTAIGYLLLLALVARKRGLSTAAERWFAGYMALSTVWTMAWAFAYLWQGIPSQVVSWGDSMAVYAAALLPPTLAVLTLHFLPGRGVREIALLGLIWAAAVVVVERRVVDVSQVGIALDALRLVGWAGFILGSLAVTALQYVRLRRPLRRNRVLYWLIALILVALGEGLYHFRGKGIAEIGLPLRLLGAIMMTYAITTYSLPDLKSVGRRILLLTIVTLVRALLYLVAIVGAVIVFQFVTQQSLDEQRVLWLTIIGGMAGAFLLAVLQVPIQNVVAGMAERLLFGPGYDANRALRHYSESISNILHIERLATVAIETISEALDVELGALLAITGSDDGGADVRVIPGTGDIAAMNVTFTPDSPVLRALRDTNQPLTQYDIDMLPEFRAMDPKERQWQWALDVEVYVPIYVKQTLIGALALGAKQTGEPYNAQDLAVLNTLAGQTAVALENARLFDDQSRLNREISQLNEELIAANTRLERVDKAKTDFLTITSHELRTPLTQVRGYVGVLDEMISRGETSQSFVLKIAGNIHKAANRLEKVYAAMLDVSAIGADAFQLHLEPIRPVVFIAQAVTQWREALRQRQMSFVIDGIEELPALAGDRERLVQAFSSLINNAIKFTPDGGKIEIRGRVVPGPEPVIEIIIADEGIGVDAKDQGMIFEKFYRVDDADLHSTGDIKFKGGGPGLGLPIAKGVIEGHGGRIWVESAGYDEQNCPGSRFHVLLPVRSGLSDTRQVSQQLKKTRPMRKLARRLVSRTAQKENHESG